LNSCLAFAGPLLLQQVNLQSKNNANKNKFKINENKNENKHKFKIKQKINKTKHNKQRNEEKPN